MAYPVFIQEKPPQVRMVVKPDTEKVENLSFVKFSGSPDVANSFKGSVFTVGGPDF
jgi:hypothetical protein